MIKIKLTFCSGSRVELFRVDCSIGGGLHLSLASGGEPRARIEV